MATIAGLTLDKWRKVAPTVKAKFPRGDDGKLHNAKARLVLEKIFCKDASIDAKPLTGNDNGVQPEQQGTYDQESNIQNPLTKDKRSDHGGVNNGDNFQEGGKPIGQFDPLNFLLDRYDVIACLSDTDIDRVRDQLQGGDMYHYAAIFNEAVKSGRFKKPSVPVNAFIGWLKSYRNGKGREQKR